MKRWAAIIGIVACVVAIATLFSTRFLGIKTCHAVARVLLNPNQDPNFVWEPYWGQHQFQTISNLFSKPEVREMLANRSGVSATNFTFAETGPVRGTRIIYVAFEGTESNQVFNVASNAAVQLVEWYSTNHPTWGASNVDTFGYEPRTSSQMKWENVCNAIARFWKK